MFITSLLIFSNLFSLSDAVCVSLNNCNGHGKCNYGQSTCECDPGWGASADITLYRSPDCSQRTCPAGKSWGDVATSTNQAHHKMECSNRGMCNRGTGKCACFPGFGGPACNRRLCPNDCSGHGTCVSMRDMAKLDRALPLGPNVVYGLDEGTVAWDDDIIYGCVCDSTWKVGLLSGETQTPEWFGADCSLRHCPSADDPRTVAVETDCFNVTAAGSTSVGAEGNLCHVDCANRGLCNYATGTCKCFFGYKDVHCGEIIEAGGYY